MRLRTPRFRADRISARFDGGPWDGLVRSIPALSRGGPPDFVPALIEGHGIYALAGAEDGDGHLRIGG
jgi:hypothetical protein